VPVVFGTAFPDYSTQAYSFPGTSTETSNAYNTYQPSLYTKDSRLSDNYNNIKTNGTAGTGYVSANDNMLVNNNPEFTLPALNKQNDSNIAALNGQIEDKEFRDHNAYDLSLTNASLLKDTSNLESKLSYRAPRLFLSTLDNPMKYVTLVTDMLQGTI